MSKLIVKALGRTYYDNKLRRPGDLFEIDKPEQISYAAMKPMKGFTKEFIKKWEARREDLRKIRAQSGFSLPEDGERSSDNLIKTRSPSNSKIGRPNLDPSVLNDDELI